MFGMASITPRAIGERGNRCSRLIDRLIDETTFNDRKQRLILEKAKVTEQVKNCTADRATLDDARKFLELVKTLTELYETAFPGEKREMVKSTTSNRTVSGKNVYLEPSNWLKEVKNASGVVFGAPFPDDYRIFMNKLTKDECKKSKKRFNLITGDIDFI